MNQLIVCATDFSPQSDSALAWAAAVARRDGSPVDLIHVAPAVREDTRMLVFDTAQFDAEGLRVATERLREAARAAAQELDVSIRPQLLRGEPHESILGHARREEARMIVLGTGESGAVERWMLGSVAARTMRSADRPVVLVPRRPDPAVWLAGRAGEARRAPRVLAALGDHDGSDDRSGDGSILGFVAGLRREVPCDVTFLHLYWPIEEYARLGLQGARDLFEVDPDVVKNLEPALRVRIDGLPGEGAVKLDIRAAWGDPAANLLVAVEDSEADLLVVGAHERHGVTRFLTGSIAQRLARHSRYVPIAIVPAAPATLARPAGIPTLRTILAVTDLSTLGNAAVAHAYTLVRGTGGTVELCHVHEHALPSPSYAYDAAGPGLTDVERARMLKELRDLVPAEAKSLGIATHVSIVDGGKAAEAIVQAAERLDADAIAMASHGRGGLARTVLGSVTGEVVHRAHRPVYVVRSGRQIV
jgi:nucleotide-binding universal stress UspA family protein